MKYGQNETDLHLQRAVELIVNNTEPIYEMVREQLPLRTGETKCDRDGRMRDFIRDATMINGDLQDAVISAALGSIDWAGFCDDLEDDEDDEDEAST